MVGGRCENYEWGLLFVFSSTTFAELVVLVGAALARSSSATTHAKELRVWYRTQPKVTRSCQCGRGIVGLVQAYPVQ